MLDIQSVLTGTEIRFQLTISYYIMKVVVCTPTYNRRWAYEFSRDCLNKQLEQDWVWLVVDNSDDSEKDWSPFQHDDRVVYHKIEGKKPVAWLRNYCLEQALKLGFEYLVFWDDDDYYPPTRISGGISALEKTPDADIAGSTRMYILLTRENVMMLTGPFQENHATAATWTVRRRYVEKNKFDETRTRGEEVSFTKDWKAKMVQVSPEECIVVMGHAHNTVDKSEILKHPRSYRSDIVNTDNGKMVFRSRWPVNWELWKKTFL